MENYISKAPKWKGKPLGLTEAGEKPDPAGTIYRGIGFTDKKVVESIIESYKRGDAALTMESWTTKPGVAGLFMEGEPHKVLIKQVNKYGTSIEPWNGMGEKEILQPRGVRYKVLSSTTQTYEGSSLTEIVLEAF